MDSGLAALLGSLVGAGAVLFAGRWQWKRERRVRWEDVKRALYLDFISAMKGVNRNTMLALQPGNPNPDEHWHKAAESWFAANQALDHILIVAPTAVQAAAAEVIVALGEARQGIRANEGLETARGTYLGLAEENRKQVALAATRADLLFLRAARRDINPEEQHDIWTRVKIRLRRSSEQSAPAAVSTPEDD